jgi:hypothetical protein
MEVKTRAVKALMESPAVIRAPPAIRDWLLALLVRGEGASQTRGNVRRSTTRRHKESAGVK